MTKIREKARKRIIRARWLIFVELFFSIVFNITMIGTIKNGHLVNILLSLVITLNLVTAARLLVKLYGVKCASSIMAYVVWKIIQEIIMVPVLVIFTFVLIDKYLKSWNSSDTAVHVLIVIWTYSLYSFILVIYLIWLARSLWKTQNHRLQKSEYPTTISFIDTEDLLPSGTSEIELRSLQP